jgi:hypothetical protein
MHITVAWEIKAKGQKWSDMNEVLKAVIKPYSWARPLSGLYIIKVSSSQERQKIADGLTAAVKSADVEASYVMSPVMDGGSYEGWLPKAMWDSINERTK